jgi:RNA polymerase sigma-70 factor (ECF subfamily)
MAKSDDDGSLLTRVANGDVEAFEDLYARYARRLFGFALRITRRPELVEEVVNDTLLAVWRSAGSFDGRSKPSTWIFGIAYRKSLRALQRRRPAEIAVPEPRGAVDERAGPEQQLQQREMLALVDRALASLPPEQRAVVELTFFSELSYAEVAAVVDCPVNTVKTRMFHARRKLREALPRLAAPYGAGGVG